VEKGCVRRELSAKPTIWRRPPMVLTTQTLAWAVNALNYDDTIER
jgi:hypothetical protein